MLIKCPVPGCSGTECFEVRPVYEVRREFRPMRFWRGVHTFKVLVGHALVCTRCDAAFVATASETFPTSRTVRAMEAGTLVPMGQPKPPLREVPLRAVGIEP